MPDNEHTEEHSAKHPLDKREETLRGELSVLPPEIAQSVPSPLLQIALKAMAPAPGRFSAAHPRSRILTVHTPHHAADHSQTAGGPS